MIIKVINNMADYTNQTASETSYNPPAALYIADEIEKFIAYCNKTLLKYEECSKEQDKAGRGIRV